MRHLLLYLAITLQVLRQIFSFTRVQLSLEEIVNRLIVGRISIYIRNSLSFLLYTFI